MDHRQELRQSQLRLADQVESITDAQLELPTLCGQWTVNDLIAHVVAVQHNAIDYFGSGGRPDDPDTDIRQRFRIAADTAWQGLRADATLRETVHFGGADRPGWVVVSFYFVDALVHQWDLARATAAPVHLDEELVSEALSVAKLVPADAAQRAELGAFGPIVPGYEAADDLDRLLSLLGRDPKWTAP